MLKPIRIVFVFMVCLMPVLAFSQFDGRARVDSIVKYEKAVKSNGVWIHDKEWFSIVVTIFGHDSLMKLSTVNNKYLKDKKAGDRVIFYYDITTEPYSGKWESDTIRHDVIEVCFTNKRDPSRNQNFNFPFTAKVIRSVATIDSIIDLRKGMSHKSIAYILKGKRDEEYFSYAYHMDGRDFIAQCAVTNDKFLKRMKAGDEFPVFFDPSFPHNGWRIITSHPVLDKNMEIDTSVARVSYSRHINSDGYFADRFRVQFVPKDSTHMHTLKIPLFEEGGGFGADIFQDYPQFIEHRKLYAVYERKNPDKVYLVTEHPADSATYRYYKRNNMLTINTIPTTMTVLGYERRVFNVFALGVDWSYYYPKMGNGGGNYYGFINNDGYGAHNDIPDSYYNIGQLNRFDINLKIFPDVKNARAWYIKVLYSYELARDLKQIYFNKQIQPTFSGDSSVTAFLAANSSNRVYYRNVSFNAAGWGLGFGCSFFIDHNCRFLVGLDIGTQLAYIPDYAKQPVWISGEQYFYQYTPAWESVINMAYYGHVTFSYRF